MTLDIIIPLYNEENSITTVLGRIQQLDFEGMVSTPNIIVVDDCSTDKSCQSVENFAKNNANVKLVKHDINQGKGAAVRTGISQGSGDFIVIQDADLELLPTDMVEMVRFLKKLDLEFINGSRYMPGIIRPLYSYKRYFFNKLFTKLASILINVRLTDLACGYKMFSRNIYNQISLKEDRFGFEAELLIKVARLKKTLISEVPVHYFPRNTGDGKKLGNLDGIKIFWTIIKYGFFHQNKANKNVN